MRLAEIEEIIGEAGLMALSREWGGIRLHIPKRLAPDHPIVLALGAEKAGELCRQAAGEWVEIPRATSIEARQRAEEVIRLRSSGLSQTETARRMKLSQRWVRAIESRHRERQQSGASLKN